MGLDNLKRKLQTEGISKDTPKAKSRKSPYGRPSMSELTSEWGLDRETAIEVTGAKLDRETLKKCVEARIDLYDFALYCQDEDEREAKQAEEDGDGYLF